MCGHKRLLAMTIAAGLAGGAIPACAQVARLYPVDEAVTQPVFFTFRASFVRVVQARDTASLYGSLASDVLSSFGGDGGVAEFKASWNPADSDSRLWETLATVLALGGSFHDDTLFSAPYTFSRFPPELDAFEHLVVVGSNVSVRAEPHATAPVLAALSFDIVPASRDAPSYDDGGEWAAVTLHDGRTGFVHGDHVRSPIDYRVTFVRRGGVWLLRSLVAGD
jgi:hypothetical protein